MLLGSFWNKFKEITSDQSPVLGTVVERPGQEEYIVNYRSGGTSLVYSSIVYQIGDSVLVLGDKITKKTENMQYFEAEV